MGPYPYPRPTARGPRFAIGLMSGTSVDAVGVPAVLYITGRRGKKG